MEGNEMNILMERNYVRFLLSSSGMFVNYNVSVKIYPENKKGETER
ncbi:hypothetical protein AQPE_3147 [Aquipluma nitroreducens]|uniref:Uncharacterized protein n=1 Tax=Aquipluma nitroreducens TaxID=2010828 RepID=A0A5K7SCF6_9BACT|nr:hypothetical protein AQPE_3147 [Aquipluma nitroreducens]